MSEYQAMQWIPTKEQAPPPYTEILMTVHEIGWNGEEYDRVVCRTYSGQTNVLAWMPKPEPYKGDTK